MDRKASALEVVGLSKSFGGLRAVRGFDLAVSAGTICGLIGPNGAGKTTVLNIVSGLLRPDAGSVSVLGDGIEHLPAHRVARAGVARTYQNLRLFPGMTVLQTVMAGAYLRRSSRLWQAVGCTGADRRERRLVEARSRDILQRVGVETTGRLAEQLSYGEQRRVEIARAIAAEPKVVLLDEPSAGMNDAESKDLGQLLLDLQEGGMSFVLVEHNVKLVLQICSKVTVMNFGEVIARGSPRQCLADRDVQRAYFGRESDAERIQAVFGLRRDPSASKP